MRPTSRNDVGVPFSADAAGREPVVGRETGTSAQARAVVPGGSLTMVSASSLPKREVERVPSSDVIENPEGQRTPYPSGRPAEAIRRGEPEVRSG